MIRIWAKPIRASHMVFRNFSSAFDFTPPKTFVASLPLESPSTKEPFGIKISEEAIKVSSIYFDIVCSREFLSYKCQNKNKKGHQIIIA